MAQVLRLVHSVNSGIAPKSSYALSQSLSNWPSDPVDGSACTSRASSRSRRWTEFLAQATDPQPTGTARGALSFAYEVGPCGHSTCYEITGAGHDCQVVPLNLILRQPTGSGQDGSPHAVSLTRLHRAGELSPGGAGPHRRA